MKKRIQKEAIAFILLLFSNTKGHMGDQVIDNKSDFVYTGGTTALYQVIPSEKEDTECMSLEIQSDCVITGFEALDYLEIENLKVFVNGKAASIADGISVHEGDTVDFSYNLGYKSGVHDWNLLKTTKLVSYKNAEGKKCVFSDAQGFMVINYVNDNFVKDYIDNAFGDK